MNKKELYRDLVAKRKADKSMAKYGYKNQSDFPEFDSDEIGNYSMWANDLDADLMIIAQDYCDQKMFEKCRDLIQTRVMNNPEVVKDWETKTNYYLSKLLNSINRDIGLPYAPKKAGVFLTNTVLGIKNGSMSDKLKSIVVEHEGSSYLKPLIDLVQPKKLVTLGIEAKVSLLKLYSDEEETLRKRLTLKMKEQFQMGKFSIRDGQTEVFPLYHPGLQGQSGRGQIEKSKDKTGFELMVEDWRLIKNLYRCQNSNIKYQYNFS